MTHPSDIAPPRAGLLRRLGPGLALFALALAAYYPALRAGTVWDDKALTENPLVRDPAGLFKIWFAPSLNPYENHYWPLVYTSFWIEYRLWGLALAGYHLTNILLHALCGLLLWRLLRRLAVPGPWLAAAIFVLHPVHVESVAWIIERKDLLSAAFYLAAALAYLRYECGVRNAECGMNPHLTTHPSPLAPRPSPLAPRPSSLAPRPSPLAPFALFSCALLCKSMVVTFPAALALLCWWRRGRLDRRDARPLLALTLLAVAAAAADWAFSLQSSALTTSGLTPLGRLLVAGRALWFYLAKLAWPHPLAALYPQWSVLPGSLLAWLPLAGALALASVLWAARPRLGRGPFAAFAFFALTLAPALGLIEFNFMGLAWVADRFQYLASIGPIALFSVALTHVRARIRARNRSLGVPPSGGIPAEAGTPEHDFSFNFLSLFSTLLLLILAVLTWRQAATYRDSLTLFNHAVAAYPAAWAPRLQLGLELAKRERYPDALAQVAEALRLNPQGCAPIHDELARLQARLGRPREAEQNYRRALELDPDNPVFHNSLGVFLAGSGREPEALEQFRAAVRLRPAYPDALSNLAGAWLRRGQPGPALGAARKAAALSPYSAEHHAALALACAANGLVPEALAEYRAALRLDPALPAAHANLGGLLLEQGDAAGAIPHLETALRLGLGDARLHFMLGEAYRLTGHPREATAQYAETLRLDPRHPEAPARKAECERAGK